MSGTTNLCNKLSNRLDGQAKKKKGESAHQLDQVVGQMNHLRVFFLTINLYSTCVDHLTSEIHYLFLGSRSSTAWVLHVQVFNAANVPSRHTCNTKFYANFSAK